MRDTDKQHRPGAFTPIDNGEMIVSAKSVDTDSLPRMKPGSPEYSYSDRAYDFRQVFNSPEGERVLSQIRYLLIGSIPNESAPDATAMQMAAYVRGSHVWRQIQRYLTEVPAEPPRQA